MLNKIKTSILLIVLSFGSVLNVSASDQVVLTEANNVTDGIVLAELIFHNGNKMYFGHLPESNEMYVEEHVELGDGEIFILDHLHGNLLDKYLTVTPPGTSVPQKLIEFEQENDAYEVVLAEDHVNEGAHFLNGASDEVLLYEQGVLDRRMDSLAGRNVVNSLPKALIVDWAELNPDVVSNFKAAGQGSCNNSTGYLFFIDHHCNISGSHGSGGSQTFCDYPMQHNSYQRTSSDRMRSTYSRVVNCGPGDVAIIHSKKTGGFWYELKTWFMGVNEARAVESWAGKHSIRKQRRVNTFKVTPGGYMRAWTKFTRNSK